VLALFAGIEPESRASDMVGMPRVVAATQLELPPL
jgi:hypothetical protein